MDYPYREPHDRWCRCDLCDGERYIERHIPNEALFDGDQHRDYERTNR